MTNTSNPNSASSERIGDGGAQRFQAEPTPRDALTVLEMTAEPYVEPPESRGSIGRTMFDLPTSSDGTLIVVVPKDRIDRVPSQSNPICSSNPREALSRNASTVSKKLGAL